MNANDTAYEVASLTDLMDVPSEYMGRLLFDLGVAISEQRALGNQLIYMRQSIEGAELALLNARQARNAELIEQTEAHIDNMRHGQAKARYDYEAIELTPFRWSPQVSRGTIIPVLPDPTAMTTATEQ